MKSSKVVLIVSPPSTKKKIGVYQDFFSVFYRFSDKTKNDWANRSKFVKVSGKYDLLQMDYSAKVF